jgi:hypothetical protein
LGSIFPGKVWAYANRAIAIGTPQFASEWRMASNGFRIKTALYSESGDLLSLTFFSHLLINNVEDVDNFYDLGRVVNVDLNTTKNYNNLMINNAESAEKVAKEIFEKVLKKLDRKIDK